ncbi:MAG TPA: hypothetical protein VEX37_12630 [Thermomicrobiales bacterium]|nr:hypothetical protein [Thermomicrobiales bacterium]
MFDIDLMLPVLDTWVDAALWDLLGMTLWGSLLVSAALTIVGVVRRSPWTLMLGALLSLPFCGPMAFLYTERFLVVPIVQAALATMMVAVRRTQST